MKCKERVYDGSTLHGRSCSRDAVEGSEYCKQHSPEAKAARSAKSDARYEVKSALWDADWEMDSIYKKLVASALEFSSLNAPDGCDFRAIQQQYLAASKKRDELKDKLDATR